MHACGIRVEHKSLELLLYARPNDVDASGAVHFSPKNNIFSRIMLYVVYASVSALGSIGSCLGSLFVCSLFMSGTHCVGHKYGIRHAMWDFCILFLFPVVVSVVTGKQLTKYTSNIRTVVDTCKSCVSGEYTKESQRPINFKIITKY